MNRKPGSVAGPKAGRLPSVLKSRLRPFSAVYPRLTGGQPARMRDFAPDEACRFPASPENGFEFCQGKTGLSPRKAGILPTALPPPRWALTPPFHPYLTTKNAKKLIL